MRDVTRFKKNYSLYRQEPRMEGSSCAICNTILNGIGPPTSNLGLIDDLYIDTNTMQLYGPKTEFDWGPPHPLMPSGGAALPVNSVQFNNFGVFVGDSTLTFDNTSKTLTAPNVIVSGDLTVNGSMATVNTTNLEVKDSVIGLGFASGTIAQTAGDRGLIGGLAGTSNVALLWKNSNSEFVMGRTTSSATGSFNITSLSNLRLSNIQANIVTASLGFTGSLTKLINGEDYLRAGAGITLTTGSLGQVTVASTSASPSNSIQFNNNGVFGGSADLTFTPSVNTGFNSLNFNGRFSHGLGQNASGEYSYAQGVLTNAEGYASHAEGTQTKASNFYSHAEGYATLASEQGSHSEGYLTSASAQCSHAEGYRTEAVANYSHTAGVFTIASGSGQNVVGKYNKRNNSDSLFIVGNGDGDANARRSDIFLVNTGSVLVGSASLANDTFFYVGTKGTATNARFDGSMVVSGTFDVKNGSANSVLSVNGSKVGVGTASPIYTLEVNGSFAATTKSFVIDHPNKPGWKLRHGSLEGPENGVYVRGRTSSNEILLPSYWVDLVDETSITVQITPIGSKLTYFISSIDVNKICVEFDTGDVEYCYLVQASRKDETFEVEYESV